jgi:hypothetical protein
MGPLSLEDFHTWLVSQGKTKATIKETLNYSKRFGRVLDTGDASSLLALSIRNKHHAQTALANLAKFKGVYTDWFTYTSKVWVEMVQRR